MQGISVRELRGAQRRQALIRHFGITEEQRTAADLTHNGMKNSGALLRREIDWAQEAELRERVSSNLGLQG